jgi:Ca-activated chloride channel family protein
VLAGVVGRDRVWRRWVPPGLFLVALGSLGFALARPHVETLVPNERALVILVIDASRSMQTPDVAPTRLVAAQASAKVFLDRVPKRLRVGLIVFAGDVQVGAPPTTDHDLVRRSIDSIDGFSGFGGTAIGDAIARAVELGTEAVDGDETVISARAAPSAGGRGLVSILFLSDGRQNRGVIPPLRGAALARDAGIPVFTVALGTPNGGGGTGPGPYGGGRNRAPDPATLRAIARLTNGEFFEARTSGELRAAYANLGSRLGRAPGRSEVTYAFLLGALGVLVAAGLLSARWSARLP